MAAMKRSTKVNNVRRLTPVSCRGRRDNLVMDVIDRVPETGEQGIYLKQQLKDKLIEHKQYIDKNGEDMPEIRNWKWSIPQ